MIMIFEIGGLKKPGGFDPPGRTKAYVSLLSACAYARKQMAKIGICFVIKRMRLITQYFVNLNQYKIVYYSTQF
jgi:hypothetical protein